MIGICFKKLAFVLLNHALERHGSFVSIRGSDLCPRCWINNEVRGKSAAYQRWS